MLSRLSTRDYDSDHIFLLNNNLKRNCTQVRTYLIHLAWRLSKALIALHFMAHVLERDLLNRGVKSVAHRFKTKRGLLIM